MKKCGIYGIRNSANGKWYIGQSVDIAVRKKTHLYVLRKNLNVNQKLQAAFLKYGEASLEWHILEETSTEMLDVRERAWINYYQSIKNGYNIAFGGHINHGHSLETRRKMSEAKKHLSPESRKRIAEGQIGKHHSEETRSKMSQAQKKRFASEEERRKQSEALKGRQFSEETRRKISEAQKGKHHTEESKQKMSVWQKGKKKPPRSEEHKRNLSNAMKLHYLKIRLKKTNE